MSNDGSSKPGQDPNVNRARDAFEAGFDPYYLWLGISRRERPPNYYRLLDVEIFEADLNAIEVGFNRRMAYLKNIKGGEHLDDAEKLKNELSQARHCLLHADKKAKYDAQLKADLAARKPDALQKPAAHRPANQAAGQPQPLRGSASDGQPRDPLADPFATSLFTTSAIKPFDRLRQSIREIVADNVITDDEMLQIQGLRESLGVTREDAQRIFAEVIAELPSKTIPRATAMATPKQSPPSPQKAVAAPTGPPSPQPAAPLFDFEPLAAATTSKRPQQRRPDKPETPKNRGQSSSPLPASKLASNLCPVLGILVAVAIGLELTRELSHGFSYVPYSPKMYLHWSNGPIAWGRDCGSIIGFLLGIVLPAMAVTNEVKSLLGRVLAWIFVVPIGAGIGIGIGFCGGILIALVITGLLPVLIGFFLGALGGGLLALIVQKITHHKEAGAGFVLGAFVGSVVSVIAWASGDPLLANYIFLPVFAWAGYAVGRVVGLVFGANTNSRR